jgi:hypothetical protein
MQPNSDGLPQPDPNTDETHQSPSSRRRSRSSNNIRLTESESLKKLVNVYNSTTKPETRRKYEHEIRDLLQRLQGLILQSSIVDENRVDSFRSSENAAAARKSTNSSFSEKTRRYSSQARSSLVAFSFCRAKALREKGLDVLNEALNINYLGSDSFELDNLLILLKELQSAVETLVDKIKSKRSLLSNESIASSSNIDMRIPVDTHLERLLLVSISTLMKTERLFIITTN